MVIIFYISLRVRPFAVLHLRGVARSLLKLAPQLIFVGLPKLHFRACACGPPPLVQAPIQKGTARTLFRFGVADVEAAPLFIGPAG